MPAHAERRVQRDAYTLYARDYPGEGPAFVLMHGFPDNLGIYDSLAPSWLSRAAASSPSTSSAMAARISRLATATQHLGVAEHLKARFPASELVVLPLGHWPQIDGPEQVAEALLHSS
jgi:pimeloyl-ACP methyl ester carboxylesterase